MENKIKSIEIYFDTMVNNVLYFDIKGANNIHLVKVRADIEQGDIVNVYSAPSKKEGMTWAGKDRFTHDGLIESIKASGLFPDHSVTIQERAPTFTGLDNLCQ